MMKLNSLESDVMSYGYASYLKRIDQTRERQILSDEGEDK
jgi:hypothetical protein